MNAALDISPEADRRALLALINGYQISQAIHVVATLGIPDLLGDETRGVDDLAILTKSSPGALYRVLRALAAAGLFREREEMHFCLTQLGAGLRGDAPHSRSAWAKFVMRPPHWAAWGKMLHSVRTGESAFRHLHGLDVWTYRAGNRQEAAFFDHAMRERSGELAADMLKLYDFSQFTRIVDVGGGDGALLAGLLSACLWASGLLLDLPHVVASAPNLFKQVGVDGRCSVSAGSFFEHVPSGGDAYLLKHILHDWADAQALAILRNCRAAMAGGAKLLVIERVMAPRCDELEASLSDLNMLVNAGGRERTRDEFTALLEMAGFSLAKTVALGAAHYLIEAVLTFET
jgi:hypothetical protein